jgi:shikimate kinase
VKQSIVLIGPMGSGKTTLGKRLASDLGIEFVDTDKAVARHHGAITRIFETKGEAHFRDLETKALEKALKSNAVVATGGGAVLSEVNQNLIRAHHVIFLDTAAEHVLGKINLAKRPLLKDNPEKWRKSTTPVLRFTNRLLTRWYSRAARA